MQVFKATNFLTPEDFKKFLLGFDKVNSYKATPDIMKLCASIQYYCALRISEVLTLRRDDFDLKNRILTLSNTKTGFKKCKCSTWEKKKLVTCNDSCVKCKGLGKYRIKQFTTIPSPLIILLSNHLKSLKWNKELFNFNRTTAWKEYKQAGKNMKLEIREQQQERNIEGIWTHLLRSSYIKFMREKGASVELCAAKLRHKEKNAVDHYLRVDLQAVKIWEAKQFG